MTDQHFDKSTFPFWYGSAHMSYILSKTGPQDLIVRGEDCWLIDRSGRRFLDSRSGIGNMILGYSRHDIIEAMQRQALEVPFVCTLRYDRPAPVTVDCAAALVAVAPRGLTRVRFTHTGSSATEAALLMARRYHVNRGQPDRTQIVGLIGGYHGSTMMSMAAGGERMLHELFAPMPPGFHHLRAPEPAESKDAKDLGGPADDFIKQVREIGVEKVAAIIFEPVAGLSGRPLPSRFLTDVRQFCTEHGILLVFDEVFSGLGRMGPMFAAEISGVCPDIMCLSKTLTAGYAPLGAVLATDQVYDAFDHPGRHFVHGSSTDAHPISCAAALATLRALTGGESLKQAARVGERIHSALVREFRACPLVAGVRSNGSYIAIDLNDRGDFMARMTTRRHLQAECEKRGLLVDYTPYIFMLVPPYVLPDNDADRIVEIMASVFCEFKEEDVDPSRLRPPGITGRR